MKINLAGRNARQMKYKEVQTTCRNTTDVSHDRGSNIHTVYNHDPASNKCHDSTRGTFQFVAKKKVGKPRTEAVVLATPASHQVLTERHGHQLSPWALTARVNAGPAHEGHAEISGN